MLQYFIFIVNLPNSGLFDHRQVAKTSFGVTFCGSGARLNSERVLGELNDGQICIHFSNFW